jgi:hypothetical protein
MLNRTELADKLQACVDAKLSVNAFEDWFEDKSWNVHQTRDEQLTAAVFRIESWMTARNEGRLSDEAILACFGRLIESTRPLAQPPVDDAEVVEIVVGDSLPWRTATTQQSEAETAGERLRKLLWPFLGHRLEAADSASLANAQ